MFLSKDTARSCAATFPTGHQLVDLGPTRLRGRREREHVFALSAPGVAAPPPGTECPYPGLIAFGPDDADRYFGRDAVVADLVERLHRHPFVAVIGASGSGKSSVLRAGVGPRWPEGADVITPGATPTLDGVADRHRRLLVVDQFEELFTQVDVPTTAPRSSTRSSRCDVRSRWRCGPTSTARAPPIPSSRPSSPATRCCSGP